MCRWMAWRGQRCRRGAAVQDAARADRSELALPHGRRDDQRRRLRPGLVRAGVGPAVYHSVSPAWGTRTCASSRRTSRRRCSSRTCAPPPAPPCSRPTATRSATATGCSCTTASSTSSTRCAASYPRRRAVAVPRHPRLHRLRGALLSRADLRARGRSARRARARDRLRRGRRRARHRAPLQTSIGVSDGHRLWAFRYSTERSSRSLFVSDDAEACSGCTRTTRGCSGCATMTGSWSPSRSPTCRAPGTRSPSRPC